MKKVAVCVILSMKYIRRLVEGEACCVVMCIGQWYIIVTQCVEMNEPQSGCWQAFERERKPRNACIAKIHTTKVKIGCPTVTSHSM